MFRFIFLIYGIALTDAYTVKISGQVELGNQLSKLFKEVYSQLAENGVNMPKLDLGNGFMANQDSHSKYPHEPETEESHETDCDDSHETDCTDSHERKRKKPKNKHKESDKKDVPILDKIKQNDLEKLHLYGDHNSQERKPGEPLNNVHL